jgi:hypothetical protein
VDSPEFDRLSHLLAVSAGQGAGRPYVRVTDPDVPP